MPPSIIYRKSTDFPEIVPVFPLSGAVLLPRSALPLNIFEPRYLNMVDDALAGDRLIGMIQPRSAALNRPPVGTQAPSLADVGCLGRLTSFSETDDGRYLITLTGVARFTVIAEVETPTPYRRVRADVGPYTGDLVCAAEPEFDRAGFNAVLAAYLQAVDLDAEWDSIRCAPVETLVNALAMICPFQTDEKQALLEAPDVPARLAALTALMQLAVAGAPGGRLQ